MPKTETAYDNVEHLKFGLPFLRKLIPRPLMKLTDVTLKLLTMLIYLLIG